MAKESTPRIDRRERREARAFFLRVTRTSTIGCRSLAVLHVASAIELQLKHFATFDVRQQQLARAAGLKLVTPTA